MRGKLLALLLAGWSTTAPASPTLDDVIAAHGGAGKLEGIGSYAGRLAVTDIWVRQSPRPGPPWHTSRGTRCFSFELGGDRFAQYDRHTAAGFYPFHRLLWQDGDAAWRFNLYDGWRSRVSSVAAQRLRALRLAPTPLVAALARQRERVTNLGVEKGPDAPRVLFRYEPVAGEPMTLAFDARTRMLRSLRAGDEVIRYDGYEIVDGMPVSRRMEMDWRGETVWRLHLDAAAFGRPFPDVPSSMTSLPLVGAGEGRDPRRFRVQTLAPGVYFIGEGGTYQLFVEFRDFVVALGGVDGVERRMTALRERTGDKPLRYALVTHHHSDHLEGVPALVDAGAVLVVSPAHEAVVRKAAGPGREPRFVHITGDRRITDGERTLVFQALGPMRHSGHMLAAWLPREKLMFSADLFVQPPERPVRSAIPPIRDLLEAIERLDLDVTWFVDTHSPVVSNLADLRQAAQSPGNFSRYGELHAAVCPD